jgi:hypothetical protein
VTIGLIQSRCESAPALAICSRVPPVWPLRSAPAQKLAPLPVSSSARAARWPATSASAARISRGRSVQRQRRDAGRRVGVQQQVLVAHRTK